MLAILHSLIVLLLMLTSVRLIGADLRRAWLTFYLLAGLFVAFVLFRLSAPL